METVPSQRAGGDAICVVISSDDPRAASAASVLGLPDRSDPAHARQWRPELTHAAGYLELTMVGVDPHGELTPVVLVATEDVLLVIADPALQPAVRSAVQAADDGGSTGRALAAAALAVVRSSGEAFGTYLEELTTAERRQKVFSSADERRKVRELRIRSSLLRELSELQAQILDPNEELQALLPDEAAPLLRRARSGSALLRGSAARLYGVAGDIMSEQTAVINERLTMVSTVFLPLTLATGFFGMNFAWMTDRVGSGPAFLVLGIITPVVITLVTLLAVRRLGAGSEG